MRVITAARKPLSESTVAKNVVKHGTGGLNIDGSRIHSGPSLGGAVSGETALGQGSGWNAHTNRTTEIDRTMTKGRWPANVILMHMAGCERVGTKAVKGSGVAYGRNASAGLVYGGGKGLVSQPKGSDVLTYADPDGTETVDAWECVEGCPVAALDGQSGVLTSGGLYPHHKRHAPRFGSGGVYGKDLGGALFSNGRTFGGDKGGASRFFKQTQGTDMDDIPEDLVGYLTTMIGTPDQPGVFWDSLTDARLAETGDGSLVGLIVEGTPTEAQSVELLRILKPGGHLLLIAPDEQPTGHTGACRLEDTGFEIRDAILLAQEAGAMHYVPKASRSEREIGCWGLEGKDGHAAVGRKEGAAALGSPRTDAGRTASHVKNHHPTVKAIGIMERLLADVPLEAVVCDPFMGSGTTGIACARTGHDFIGIEMSGEYLQIADARVRHWRTEAAGHGTRAVVESDASGDDDIQISGKPDSSLMDMFWDES